MSTKEQKAVVRTFVEAVNSRDYDRFGEVFAREATISFSGVTMPCHPDAARELAVGWVAVFPDWHVDLLELVAEDDKVVAWMPWTGTQQGPLVDLQATGRRVEVDEMIMFRLVDGLVVEAREVWDEATMRRQLVDASMTAASNT
jgi:predicted ester cyclase